MSAALHDLGVRIEDHFGENAYIKATYFQPGQGLGQHAHPFDHFSVLVNGTVELDVDGEKQALTGPKILTLEKGKVHTVTALTEALWLCVWGNECEAIVASQKG